MNALFNRLTAAGIVAFLLLGLVWMYLHPDQINQYENRYANQAPAPSLSGYLDSSYQDAFEQALSDQIPLAQTGKKLYNQVTASLQWTAVNWTMAGQEDRYVNFKSLRLFNGYLTYYEQSLDSQRSALDAKVENLNACFAAHPELDFYVYYIERDTDVDFETGAQTGAAEYLRDRLSVPAGHYAFLEVNDFDTFRRYFYRTDHHWNAWGSDAGYRQVAGMLGCTELLNPVGEADTGRLLSGSKAASVGAAGVITEPFTVLLYDDPAMDITINGEPASDYGMGAAFLADPGIPASYGTYYGPDSGEIIFDTHDPSKDNLLVIGESYDNAILKLLASHFNRTYSIDLRNYQAQIGSAFRFSDYVAAHQITKVLLIGNVDYFTMDTFRLEG